VYGDIHSPSAEDILTANGWTQEDISHVVDTTVLQQAVKELSVKKRLGVMNHRFGMCGVNQYMKHGGTATLRNVLSVDILWKQQDT
jgi:hypothetical protein